MPPLPVMEVNGFQARFYGFMRVEGEVIQNDPNVDFVGRNDGFRLLNARVGIAGTFHERVGFRVSADGADDEREGPNAVNGQLRFALRDAYVDLRFAPAFGVRAGQFFTVFDLEELRPQSDYAFADKAIESRGVLAGEGWQTPGIAPPRNLGVAVRAPRLFASGAVALGYEIAAQNGNGEDVSANDNDNLAYSGALILTLPHDSIFFVAGRWNRRTTGTLPLLQTEEDLGGSAALSLAMGPIRLEGQALAIRTQFPTTGGPYQNSIGGHGQLVWRLPIHAPVEVGYRVGYLDPSDLIATDRVIEHTVGVTFGLPEWRSEIQAAFTHADEQTGRTLDNDRAQVVFQVAM